MEMANRTSSVYLIHFLLYFLTVPLPMVHCLINLRTTLVVFSCFLILGPQFDFRLLEGRDSVFCLVFLVHDGDQHHRPTSYVTSDVRGQIDCSFSVQSVRMGHFTGS